MVGLWLIGLVSGAVVAIGLPLALTIPASAAATRYEAQSATISFGSVANNHTGFSGSFVDYTNVSCSYLEWTVNAAAAGTASVTAVNGGANTIRAPATTANGGPSVDYIDVGMVVAAPSAVYQAEDATISHGWLPPTTPGTRAPGSWTTRTSAGPMWSSR